MNESRHPEAPVSCNSATATADSLEAGHAAAHVRDLLSVPGSTGPSSHSVVRRGARFRSKNKRLPRSHICRLRDAGYLSPLDRPFQRDGRPGQIFASNPRSNFAMVSRSGQARPSRIPRMVEWATPHSLAAARRLLSPIASRRLRVNCRATSPIGSAERISGQSPPTRSRGRRRAGRDML